MSASFIAAAESRAADLDRLLAVPALVCNRCSAPIASADELLKDCVPCRDGAVWCYELDLLETTAYCYSATNPDDHRFDVARFDKGACSRLLLSDGVPEAAHSWFPPFRWVNACCPSCLQQLGWVFHDESNAMCFAGVIVTKMIERRVAMHAAAQAVKSKIDLLEVYRQHFQTAFPDSDMIIPLLEELARTSPPLARPLTGGERNAQPLAAAAAAAMAAWTAASEGFIEEGAYLTEDEEEQDEIQDDEGLDEAVETIEATRSDISQSYCIFCGARDPSNEHEGGIAGRWQVRLSDPQRAMCAACEEMFERQRYGGLEEWYEYDGPADGSFFSARPS